MHGHHRNATQIAPEFSAELTASSLDAHFKANDLLRSCNSSIPLLGRGAVTRQQRAPLE
jgi:hypothetical protein